MDERDRIFRAVSSALDTDVEVAPGRDRVHPLRIMGIPRQPRFRAAWLPRGWPAEVRALLDSAPAVTLVVAPELSSGARALLDERGVNWVDETGAASVRGEGLLVRVERETPARDPEPHRASWSAAGVRAGEVTLALHPQQITVGWVAARADCSLPRASRILAGWDNEGWTAKAGPPRGRGAHRILTDPGPMLQSLAQAVNAKPLERSYAHVTTRDLEDVQGRLSEAFAGVAFGWTGWAAARELAPFVTTLPILHVRVDERLTARELAPRLKRAGVTATADTGRIELWPTDAKTLALATDTPSGPVMAWPRVFADLERLGGRGHDAAEHLREVLGSQDV